MKICIIGLPRSRSSMLLETISNYYKITILGRDIESFSILEERSGETYINKLKDLLELNSSSNDGIIRFHPLHLATIDPFKILNLDWFNFSQYKKIYFLYRKSIKDNIASNFIATKFNKFSYYNKNDLLKIVTPILFTKRDYYHIEDYIKSINIMLKVKNFLETKNIKFINLDYDDVPKYIVKNYSNTFQSHIETNYDYKKIISNYDEILKIYNLKKDSIQL